MAGFIYDDDNFKCLPVYFFYTEKWTDLFIQSIFFSRFTNNQNHLKSHAIIKSISRLAILRNNVWHTVSNLPYEIYALHIK